MSPSFLPVFILAEERDVILLVSRQSTQVVAFCCITVVGVLKACAAAARPFEGGSGTSFAEQLKKYAV